MNTLTRTIIAFVAINMITAGLAPAQNVSGEEVKDSFEIQAREAKVTAVLAQAQASGPMIPESIPSPAPAPPTKPASVAVENVRLSLDRLLADRLSSRSGSTGTVLVIPSEQTKTEDLITINEDMSVMSRIFEKSLEQARISTVRGDIFVSRQDPYSMLMGGGGGGIQSMYLQGFGALFLMKVDFPLTAPPDMQDDEKEIQKAEEGDPVWQQMRRQIYEPDKVDRRRRTDRPEEKYDAEKVENLKTTLIKALKHAANIRSLKNDESVILTITGKGQATGSTIAAARMLPGENQILVQERTADGKTITKMVTGTSLDVLDDIGLSSPMILVIRTKKSDIDEFAKGDIGFDQFRQRVQLLTYPLLGGTDGHGDPLDSYYRVNTTRSSNMRR